MCLSIGKWTGSENRNDILLVQPFKFKYNKQSADRTKLAEDFTGKSNIFQKSKNRKSVFDNLSVCRSSLSQQDIMQILTKN